MRYFMLFTLALLVTTVGCSNDSSSSSQAEKASSEQSSQENESSVESATGQNADQQTPVIVDVNEAMQKVSAYFEEGNYKAAFPLLNQLHQAKACPAEGYAIRAQILDHSGFTTQAISSLTVALTKQPNNAEWHNMLGLLFVKLQNLPMAEQAFSKAIEHQPSYAKAYNNRGLMHISRKDFDKAIKDFDVAIVQDPKYIDAYNNRGYAYLENGDYDTAIQNFTKCIEIDPEYIKGYNNRGFALLKLGDPKLAIKDFTSAIEKSPYVVKHYIHRRDAYQQLGEMESANEDQKTAEWVQKLLLLARQIQRSPDKPELLVNRAELLLEKEKYEEATQNLDAALKINKELTEAYVVRAKMFYQQKDYNNAIQACNLVLDKEQDFSANSIRGDAYFALGQLDKAIDDYQAAQRFDSMVAQAYWQRAEQKKSDGDTAGADLDRQTALKLNPSIETQIK